MKTVCKKLLCLMLVAMMLVSAVPFAFASEATSAELTMELYIDGTSAGAQSVTVGASEVLAERNIKAFAASKFPNEFNVYEYETMSPKGVDMANGNATVKVYLVTADAPVCEHENVTVGTTATCTEGGTEIERCDSCRQIVSSKQVEALGHKEGNDGKCTRCGVVLSTPTEPTEPAPTEPNYGTLKVTVYTYNANNEAKEAGTVKFTGKKSYTLGPDLAEKCFAEVGVVNYEEYRWQGASGTLDMTDGQSYNVNLVVDPIYTPGNRKIVTLTINHNRGNGNDDRQTVETLAGFKILDVLAIAEDKGYFDEPTRKGYRLAGYSFDMNCSNDVNRDDTITKNMTIYCEWERDYFAEANKYDVTLRVYTNGDTQYVDKVLNMEDYAGDGKITRTEVEKLLDKKYSAKSGYTLAYHGLFTAETWDDGDYDLDDAVSSVKVNNYGKTVIYVMVKNVKKAVADSSNPKTGDNIMIAVSTMAMSAAALVSIVELKKRKMI